MRDELRISKAVWTQCKCTEVLWYPTAVNENLSKCSSVDTAFDTLSDWWLVSRPLLTMTNIHEREIMQASMHRKTT